MIHPFSGRFSQGFSLIELLCVLGIVSILTTLAYPNYTQYIMRAHLIDGQGALLDLAQQLEQHYLETNSYESAILTHKLSPGGWYQLSIIKATQADYLLEARQVGDKTNNPCVVLTLNASGHEGPTAACWSSS